jgi:hypothetical protein
MEFDWPANWLCKWFGLVSLNPFYHLISKGVRAKYVTLAEVLKVTNTNW